MNSLNPSSTELTDWQIQKIKAQAKQDRDLLSPPLKPQSRRGPLPKYTPEERRRRHLKALLRGRHSGQKLDTYIATLKERLTLLEEIRGERLRKGGEPNEPAGESKE